MIVEITAAAELDLEGIADYIARDNPRRAISFVRELRQKCLDLREMARAFPQVRRYAHHGIRYRVHGDYLILCSAAPGRILIQRVMHGAMDYTAVFFSD